MDDFFTHFYPFLMTVKAVCISALTSLHALIELMHRDVSLLSGNTDVRVKLNNKLPAQAEVMETIALVQEVDGLTVTPIEKVVKLGTDTSIDIQLNQGNFQSSQAYF